jgi:hypothetical protein
VGGTVNALQKQLSLTKVAACTEISRMKSEMERGFQQVRR